MLEIIVKAIIAVLLVLLGIVIVPYAEKRGWLKNDKLYVSEQIIDLLKGLVYRSMPGESINNKASIIFESLITALNNMKDINEDSDLETQKAMTYSATIAEINKLGMLVDRSDEHMIRILVDHSVEIVGN
jgi:hypothetical protein